MNLTSAKIVKVERNGKKQACMFFSIAETQRTETQRTETQRTETQRTEAQRTETQRTEAESKSDGRAKGILCFGN